METNLKRNNHFSAISINRITAERFRMYSKRISPSHSDTVDMLIDFFEETKIHPKNEYAKHYIRLQQIIVSRTDYIIELLREQERKYHKPVHDMISSLFDGTALDYARRHQLEEPRFKERTQAQIKDIEPKIALREYNKLKEEHKQEKAELLDFLEKVKRIEPRFGKAYYRIETNAMELAQINRRLQK